MVEIPTTEIEGETWLLLKKISDRWLIRAVDIEAPRQVKEPSDHRGKETKAEGGVKCRPTKSWDLTNYTGA